LHFCGFLSSVSSFRISICEFQLFVFKYQISSVKFEVSNIEYQYQKTKIPKCKNMKIRKYKNTRIHRNSNIQRELQNISRSGPTIHGSSKENFNQINQSKMSEKLIHLSSVRYLELFGRVIGMRASTQSRESGECDGRR
jgi:hypothetical protein